MTCHGMSDGGVMTPVTCPDTPADLQTTPPVTPRPLTRDTQMIRQVGTLSVPSRKGTQ